MLIARITPAVPPAALAPASEQAGHTLPIHTLAGEAGRWANRLLALFRGQPVSGVEWSLKFQPAVVGDNRFLLGLPREHWSGLALGDLPPMLAMPPNLWAAFLRDLPMSQTLYASFEAAGEQLRFRLYLEPLPAPAWRRHPGGGQQGHGYKWNPLGGGQGSVTRYREQPMPDRAAFDRYMAQVLRSLGDEGMRQLAGELMARASALADPSGFLVMAADETTSRRDSCSVTFTGTAMPVADWQPALLALVTRLGASTAPVQAAFIADDPRHVRSVAVGTGRDGQPFLTLYYG